MKNKNFNTAIFAGGCFWCTEAKFRNLNGVISVVSGYTGGKLENPTYEQVSERKTGHLEAVKIKFDSEKVSYEKLLDIYWRSINPTDEHEQFADKGNQYKTAIFYEDKGQKNEAESSKKEIEKFLGKKVSTKILPAKKFYSAEEGHQNYAGKNPIRYKTYEVLSGRKNYLKKIWS